MISTVKHVIEDHVLYRGLNTKGAEGVLTEILNGFPFYGVSPVLIVLGAVFMVIFFIGYSFVGKGTGSHAGREEVRRAYRRKLAQEMAKQDAEKIRAGEKPRRKWMQW